MSHQRIPHSNPLGLKGCPLHAYGLVVHTPAEAATLVASGCGCEDLTLAPASTFTLAAEAADAPPTAVTWAGVIGVENEITGDGRILQPGSLSWDTLPMPLRWAGEDVGRHDGAQVVGRILTIERAANGQILGTGDFDISSDVGYEAARQVDEGLTPGISMDLDNVSFQILVAKELITGENAINIEKELADSDPNETHVPVYSGSPDDEIMATTSARIRAATQVAIPAFESARIHLTSELPDRENSMAASGLSDEDIIESLVAGGFPVEPPAEWFNDPQLSGPTALKVTKDGHVYGHIAAWGTCHTGYSGQCVEPPHSLSNYARYRLGAVLTKEGSEIPIGRITIGTTHAPTHMTATEAMAHYENTGHAVADVAAGEDIYGIWVAGALRPNVTAAQVRELRASPISGDWRRVGGHLELVAALGVNMPGFPVPRPQGLVASGVMQTLIASGMIAPEKVKAPGTEGAFSTDDLRYLQRIVQRERQAESEERLGIQSKVDEMAARLRATKVHEMAARIDGGDSA